MLGDSLDLVVPARGRSDFRTTCWTLIRMAQGSDGRARSALYRRYRPAIAAFLARLGVRGQQLDDFTQGFFLMLEERNDIARVDQTKGSQFRNWLMVCASRYLYRVRAHEKSQRAGGQVRFVADDEAGAGCASELADWLTPEQLTAEREALGILERAELALERWYREHQNIATHRELVAGLHERDETSDLVHAQRLGKTAGGIRQERSRMRRRFADCVKAELRRRGVADGAMAERLREFDAALAVRQRRDAPA